MRVKKMEAILEENMNDIDKAEQAKTDKRIAPSEWNRMYVSFIKYCNEINKEIHNMRAYDVNSDNINSIIDDLQKKSDYYINYVKTIPYDNHPF